MSRKELIEEMLTELNVSSAFANKVPTAEFDRIIDRALKWFYQSYQYACEDRYLVIKQQYFNTPEWAKLRRIQLPDCIASVYDVHAINGASLLGNIDKEFGDTKLIGSEIYLSGTLGDNLVTLASRMAFFDLARAFILDRFQFGWNFNTHTLILKGRQPTSDVCLFCLEKIPEENLFDDDLFIRWCVAEAKRSLSRILGRFQYNMIGGIAINYDAIRQEGNEEMTAVKEEIASATTADFFMFFH